VLECRYGALAVCSGCSARSRPAKARRSSRSWGTTPRAPEPAEHTDTILSERGVTVEELIELEIDGAATWARGREEDTFLRWDWL
jgi:hypothetical protein